MGGSGCCVPFRLFGRTLDWDESSSSSFVVDMGRLPARALREPFRGKAVLVRWFAAAEAGRVEV